MMPLDRGKVKSIIENQAPGSSALIATIAGTKQHPTKSFGRNVSLTLQNVLVIAYRQKQTDIFCYNRIIE